MRPQREGLKLEGFGEVSTAATAVDSAMDGAEWDDTTLLRLGEILTTLDARRDGLKAVMELRERIASGVELNFDVSLTIPDQPRAEVIRACLGIAASGHPDELVRQSAQDMIASYNTTMARVLVEAAMATEPTGQMPPENP